MSRSYKKTPIVGIAGDSDKKDKRLANRAHRRLAKMSVERGDEVTPKLRGASDVWNMSKDGKRYVGGKVGK